MAVPSVLGLPGTCNTPPPCTAPRPGLFGHRGLTPELEVSSSLWVDSSLFLWASPVAQSVKNLPAVQKTGVLSLSWEDPLEKETQPTPVSLPGKSHGQRSLVDCSLWGCKELVITEQLSLSHFRYLFYPCKTKANENPWKELEKLKWL